MCASRVGEGVGGGGGTSTGKGASHDHSMRAVILEGLLTWTRVLSRGYSRHSSTIETMKTVQITSPVIRLLYLTRIKSLTEQL